MRPRVAIVTTAMLACVSCVLPARSYGAFEEKAATTAGTVASAVQNANLAVSLAVRGRAFSPYVTTLLRESEDDASSAQSTFGSIQPPDDRSIALSDALNAIMDPAIEALSELRVAARRGHFDELPRQRPALQRAAEQLDRFLKAHG